MKVETQTVNPEVASGKGFTMAIELADIIAKDPKALLTEEQQAIKPLVAALARALDDGGYEF